MSIANLNIENALENAIISIAQADDFIITNKISCRRWRSTTDAVAATSVCVHVESKDPAVRDPHGRVMAWRVPVTIYQWARVTEDADFVQDFENFTAGLQDYLADNPSTLATASGITVYACIPQRGEDELYVDSYRGHAYKLDVMASLQ